MFPTRFKNISHTGFNSFVVYFFLFFSLFILNSNKILTQEIGHRSDTVQAVLRDTLKTANDTLAADTLAGLKSAKKKPFLEAEVKYSSDDSLTISIGQQKIYLYKNAVVDYQNIDLKANYIEYDVGSNTVSANGTRDSSGALKGKPIFTQGDETFDSDTLKYNFKTRKGLIKYIVTKQGEGFLHSDRTKRLDNGEIDISKGKYTTCDAPHPHFYIRLTKAIAIPNKEIVSGPAYLVFEDVPMPLALPFGFFPSTIRRSSGLIIPTYGEEKTNGFFLRQGGWYFVVNDYLDFKLLGDIYSRGKWGLTATSAYDVRYKFNGSFNVQFFRNKVVDDPTAPSSRDFSVTWRHSQDPKANPTSRFSANVNFSTNTFDRNQSYDMTNRLTNQKNSSISYSKDWGKSHFTSNMNISQSSQTRIINTTFPNMTFSVDRFYPFRKKTSTGKYNWLENIQVSYSSSLQNQISSVDSTFFTQKTLRNMKNGFSQTIPITLTNIKVLKIINITPGLSYKGVLYTSHLEKHSSPDTAIFLNNTTTDTIPGISYAQAIMPSLGISVSPKIFGMFQSTKPNSYIVAIRHVMTPSVSVNFSPDMTHLLPNYYRSVTYPRSIQGVSKTQKYSIYEGYLYGTPVPQGRSGSISLSLNNNLEMKVRAKNDTTGKPKKVSLLDNLNFSTSYNPYVKDFRWSTLNMNGSTRLFSQKLNLNFGANFDPYALDTSGHRIDRYQINEKGKLFRTTHGNINIDFRLQSKAADKNKSTSADNGQNTSTETSREINQYDEYGDINYGKYANFDIPWSLNISYTWSYSKPAFKTTFTHTLNVSGDINLTPKWKIAGSSGYDFIAKKFTSTQLTITRDLHCWDMSFVVVPFGTFRSYSFTIRPKASILHDVKYDKHKSFYDNY